MEKRGLSFSSDLLSLSCRWLFVLKICTRVCVGSELCTPVGVKEGKSVVW